VSGNGAPDERSRDVRELRAEAARYHAEAAEIETGVKTRELKEPPEQK
jgi:predicted ABC-class ATPase